MDWGDDIVIKKKPVEPVVVKPEVHYNTDPTQEEYENMSAATNRLWSLDIDGLKAFRDYEIDLQGGKKCFDKGDQAALPLFKYVDKNLFQKPAYKRFYDLLDNYISETGVEETVTQQEINEDWNFIDEIMKSPAMQYCHKFLIHHKHASPCIKEFKKQLYDIWFVLYRRETRNDSSGFEHVFVGEVKKGVVIGFHNWIQFYLQEKKGTVDYKGWIMPKRRGRDFHEPDGHEKLITIQFSWEGHDKMVSSTFIGTSPAFEVALFTMCFLHGHEDNHLSIGEYDVNVKCYKQRDGNKIKLGTSFPQVE